MAKKERFFCCEIQFKTARDFAHHLQTKHGARPAEVAMHMATCRGDATRRRFCKRRPVVFVQWLALCTFHWNRIPKRLQRELLSQSPASACSAE